MSLEELMNVEVITASKVSQKATEAPATVYVVTEAQIRQRGYSCIQDLLRDIPQIQVNYKGSQEHSDVYSINGIEGVTKFVLLMDGVRVNSATGTVHRIHESYPLANVKQVEIILGPASSLYGADAFTGIINIITKTGYQSKGVHLSTSYGRFNTTNNSLVIGTGNKDISFALTGKYYHSDEPKLPDFYEDDFAWYKHYKETGEMRIFSDTVQTSPIKDWKTPTDAYAIHGRLKIKDFELGYSRHFRSYSSSTGAPPSIYIYSEDAVFKNHIQSAYATHNFVSNSEKFNLNSTVSAQEFKTYPESKFLNQYAAYNDAYKYERNRTLKIEEQLSYFFSDKLNFVGGLSYQYFDAIPKTSDLPEPYDEDKASDEQNLPFPGTAVTDKDGNDLTIIQNIYHIDYFNFGSYIQFQYKPTQSITLTAGTRYDYNSRYESTVNPRIGLIYKPTDRFTAKLLYGHAYLAPSPYDSYARYGSFTPVTNENGEITGLTSSFWHLPNPDLEPQKRKSVEAYFLYYLSGNFSLSTHGFYGKLTNLILFEYVSGETFQNIPIGTVSRYINKGEGKSYGFTIRGDYKYNFSNNSGVNLFANYTFIDGDIEGNPLGYTTKHIVKSGLSFYYKKFSSYLQFQYRNESHSPYSTKENHIINDPFGVANLFTSYRFLDKQKYNAHAFLRITNLFDARYYHVGGELFSPQDPIRVNVGLKFDM